MANRLVNGLSKLLKCDAFTIFLKKHSLPICDGHLEAQASSLLEALCLCAMTKVKA